MTNKFEQLKNEARNIRMTAEEKDVMRARIKETMEYFPVRDASPAKSVKSPFNFVMFARSVAFVLVGFIAGGGGLAFASEQAIPGSILYPIKTEVLEEVVAAVQPTPEAKIAWEEERIQRRATELVLLQQKGELDEDRAKIATAKISDSHTRVEREIAILSEDLSFNGVTFEPTTTASITASAEVAPAIFSLPIAQTQSKPVMSSESLVEDPEDMRAAKSETKDLPLENRTKEVNEDTFASKSDVKEVSSIDNSGDQAMASISQISVATAESKELISKEVFAENVLEKMIAEVTKFKNTTDNPEQKTKLDELTTKAQEALSNKQTVEFYTTIREIKSILQNFE